MPRISQVGRVSVKHGSHVYNSHCLASDAAGFENAQSFEDWASEYGYDTDSRTAERTFKTVEKQARKLRQLLYTEDAYQALLFDTERL